jgi:hypothetical protein
MPGPEPVHEFVGRPDGPTQLCIVGEKFVGPENVVCVLRSLRRDRSVEDDAAGFLGKELGALDEVREVGLPERQQRSSRGIRDERRTRGDDVS